MSSLRVLFALLWVVSAAIVLVGEAFPGTWVGIYADNGRMAYVAHLVVILLTVAGVPLALRGRFSLFSIHCSLSVPLRLLLLALPAWLGFLAYYLTLSTTGLFCALIALIASLLQRLKRKDED